MNYGIGLPGQHFKQDEKIFCLCPLTTVQHFSKIRSHEVPWKRCDFATIPWHVKKGWKKLISISQRPVRHLQTSSFVQTAAQNMKAPNSLSQIFLIFNLKTDKLFQHSRRFIFYWLQLYFGHHLRKKKSHSQLTKLPSKSKTQLCWSSMKKDPDKPKINRPTSCMSLTSWSVYWSSVAQCILVVVFISTFWVKNNITAPIMCFLCSCSISVRNILTFFELHRQPSFVTGPSPAVIYPFKWSFPCWCRATNPSLSAVMQSKSTNIPH